MFETWELLWLQNYWWGIVSLLGGFLAMMLFVQGGQALIPLIGKNETDKTLLYNVFGRKWELGFTTLVLFGGAIFAAFPLFYAVSFGGAYAAWMTLLFVYIIQAVSYEYRTKKGNVYGAKIFEIFLSINGYLAPFLIGVIISTMFSGSPFILDNDKLAHWIMPTRGLEALSVPFNVLGGICVLLISRILGMLYILNSVKEGEILRITEKKRQSEIVVTLFFLALYAVWIFSVSGADISQGNVVIESNRYFHTFMNYPISVSVPFVIGLLLFLFGGFRGKETGFWFAASGAVLMVFALLLSTGIGGAPFYPSYVDLSSSLTTANSSASRYTLMVMGYVSLFVPVVLGYIAYVWYSMARPVTHEEIKNDPFSY
ncbi:cytochrome d ubiquinol oxidase subunit II [Sulfuricurvum sp.]|uniref:cytochrome d ubiquinol oxidase subunit II n=1 Tax=Sulfuricurvum sp. TaxID=2025608 RepID=UPI002D351A9A|nr:cytochrome d ubiquinol oxidase subunit II [Sulfuricurvum sp.]HZF70866.1 cytochrome d ubiquinol oxidase subunit II [Sulfuricurvum sp.]